MQLTELLTEARIIELRDQADEGPVTLTQREAHILLAAHEDARILGQELEATRRRVQIVEKRRDW